MDDIKLSERVREEYYISGSEDFCVQQFVLADEIAALEQRITALEAEVVSLRATEARLRGLLKAIHAGITVVGEGIPFNYDTWEQLEKEVGGE